MRNRTSASATAIAAAFCAVIAGCAAGTQPAAAPAIPVVSSAHAAPSANLAAASAPNSPIASPVSSEPTQFEDFVMQSPAALDSAASSTTPTNLCPLLTTDAIAGLVPSAKETGPHDNDSGLEECEWFHHDAVLNLFAQPRTTPWPDLIDRYARQDRELMGQVNGKFTMRPVPALGPQAEAFYTRAISAVDPTVGTSDTSLVWFVGNAQLDLAFIGGPSLPDETTALVKLARTVTAAAQSPSFVP